MDEIVHRRCNRGIQDKDAAARYQKSCTQLSVTEVNELSGKSFKIPLCMGDGRLTFSPLFVTAAKVSLALFTTLGEVYSM